MRLAKFPFVHRRYCFSIVSIAVAMVAYIQVEAFLPVGSNGAVKTGLNISDWLEMSWKEIATACATFFKRDVS
jgi:Flp pilus assembly pilin Flp